MGRGGRKEEKGGWEGGRGRKEEKWKWEGREEEMKEEGRVGREGHVGNVILL